MMKVRYAVSGECGKILGNFSLSSLRCETSLYTYVTGGLE